MWRCVPADGADRGNCESGAGEHRAGGAGARGPDKNVRQAGSSPWTVVCPALSYNIDVCCPSSPKDANIVNCFH